MASKLAVIGAVNGQLSSVFTKIATLHLKHNFAFVIIAGDLFQDPEKATVAENAEVTKLLNGEIEVAASTYFSLGQHELPGAVKERLNSNGGELCPNLSILGRKVSIKTSEGFRIVAVGGSHTRTHDESISEYSPSYTDQDVATLLKDEQEVDFLITSDWPDKVRYRAHAKSEDQYQNAVQSIAHLCKVLKPRYHFSTSLTYYEREPFYHDLPKQGNPPPHVTRFISLAPLNAAASQNVIKALQIKPSAPPPDNREGFTLSPFYGPDSPSKRKRSGSNAATNFRYGNDRDRAPYDWDQPSDPRQPPPKRSRHDRHNRPAQPPRPCYFCLVNADDATHMVGSVGEQCYVTICKGPLTDRTTYPQLGFPGHMLIMPQLHAPTLAALPELDTEIEEGGKPKPFRALAIAEMHRYRAALQSMVAEKSRPNPDRTADLGVVTWEISLARGVHLHWQFLPVQADVILQNLVEAAFVQEAENVKYPPFVQTKDEIAEVERGDFFKVMIWCESMSKTIVMPINGSFRFDLQFGRKVMAMLLGLENRVDWKSVAQTAEEETEDCAVFRKAFEQWDGDF